ncbi:MAG: hypothetical protein ACKV0T_25930 [Planctomycetales bacterium]
MSTTSIAVGSTEEAYRLYAEAGSAPLIDFQAFKEFWESICADDQDWWLTQFRAGTAILTKDLLNLAETCEQIAGRSMPEDVRKKIDMVRGLMR